MTGAYHSTDLKLAASHCPRALTFQEEGVPRERRKFEAGIAAHAFLQEIGQLTKECGAALPQQISERCDAVARGLLTNGRMFEGVLEPPLSSDAVFAGRDLAVAFAGSAGWSQVTPTADYEVGLAVDADRKPVPYDSPDARLAGILDMLDLRLLEDEDSSLRVLIVRDYKSAWSTSEADLETTQRKAQAVLAAAHYGMQADVLQLEVVNLRTMRVYAREVVLEGGDSDLLRQWWGDLAITMDALDAQKARGPRPAIPGAGCFGCPFITACDHAQDYVTRTRIPGTAEERATVYAAASATVEFYRELLRDETDQAPIEIPGGSVVGTMPAPVRELNNGAAQEAFDEFVAQGGDGRGFAKALKPSVGNLESLAKVMFPDAMDRGARERFIESHTRGAIKRRFGIHPKQGQEVASAASSAA